MARMSANLTSRSVTLLPSGLLATMPKNHRVDSSAQRAPHQEAGAHWQANVAQGRGRNPAKGGQARH